VVQPGRKKREDSPYAEQSRRLSAWLRSLREGAGLSQDQLARRAGVTLATLRKLEAGEIVNPGHFIVMALLGALDARPEDLPSYADPASAADERLLCAIPKAAKCRWRGIRRGITSPRNRGI
jgi:transcriptional regulator with XRE-family HTH domain